jgi:hypothetical protein
MTIDTGQRIESDDLSIGDVFKDFYAVPDYQREYVWSDEEVEQLLVDINTEFSSNGSQPSEYFIGSIVVTPNDEGTYDLIDGQQRVTTLFILLCAIRDRLRELEGEEPDHLKKMIRDSDLDDRGRDVYRYRVDLQYEDATGILQKIGASEESESGQPATRSVENILDALKFCRSFLESEFGDSADQVRIFYSYLHRQVKLIRVITRSVAHALKVFETINDRGVGLDSMDLLKNLMFMSATRDQFDKLKEEWKKLIDLLHGKEKPLRFLRYFIFATYDVDRLREDQIYSWFVSNASLCGYDDDPVGFVQELHGAAAAYVRFVDGLDVTGKENRYLQNLRRLSGAARQHLILLLAGSHLDPDRFLILTREIENLFFAYIITREPTREFEGRFAQWALELRQIRDDANAFGEFIANRMAASRRALAQRFHLAFAEFAQGMTQQYRLRYVLGKLTQFADEQAWGAEQHADLSTYTQSKVEVEHILPQNPSTLVLNDFDKPDEYTDYVGRLGNLCLLEKTINASVGNGLFKEKQAAYRQSGFLLTKSLGERVQVGSNTAVDRVARRLPAFETWSSKDIAARQRFLAELASEVWDVPIPEGGVMETPAGP